MGSTIRTKAGTTTISLGRHTSKNHPHQLHSHRLLRRATFNRIYVPIYSAAILALFYHHLSTLCSNSNSYFLNILLLISDIVLCFNWCCTQGFNLHPIHRHEFLENLSKNDNEDELVLPGVDIFICTADPEKEPPIGTVNTALSVMAYDYSDPQEISVYVSDDGGSHLTLYALMEAAKFARHWVPFCRENHVAETSPEAYFNSSSYINVSSANYNSPSQADNLKTMYESMKVRIENKIAAGEEKVVFGKFIGKKRNNESGGGGGGLITPHEHPAHIQVLSGKEEKDMRGESMPNLVYVSRQKSKAHHHHFKAGALNALVRVSATISNAPIVLTLDCDSCSNDPQTLKRAMCYFCDPTTLPTLAYLQFPQIFRGLNPGDIYYGEHKRLYQINPMAMDGLQGPNYVGTGCFFQRRAFFGGPSSFIHPEIPQLSPHHKVNHPIINSEELLALAHHVAASNYDDQTEWGSKLGFRYGSLSEDFNTGYRMHCEGWKSIFCHPARPAFLGDSPVTLIDLLGQNKRWMHGLLDIFLSKYSTITYGVRHLGLLMGLAYTNNPCWPILSIPLTLYAFLPQLALLNGVSTFPKVSDPWCLLYIFLFIAGYTKDMLDYILEKGTLKRWWNSQRMWMICGLSSFLFGFVEYILSSLGGLTMRGFNVTSKLQDDELTKRYDQGIYEFGVATPMFVPLSMAALINPVSFVMGLKGLENNNRDGLILQILLSGFVVVNCWPVYKAMAFRNDKGRMPAKVTIVAAFLALILCSVGSAFLKV